MSLVTILLDGLAIAACVFGARGRELHRTPRMRHLLAAETDAAPLLDEMRTLAVELLDAPLRRPAALVARGVRMIVDGRPDFDLRAVALPAGAIGASPVVVVELGLCAPLLPRVEPRHEELVARCGLTPREAEVAILLGRGGSDREIARQLAVSPHTVRKHAEHIFDKLRLHSRKALMLRLSEATRTMPEPDGPHARPRAAPATT